MGSITPLIFFDAGNMPEFLAIEKDEKRRIYDKLLFLQANVGVKLPVCSKVKEFVEYESFSMVK